MFITFEGIDGSGKTVLACRIADWLKEQGKEVVFTREPGGTAMGSTVRHLLEFDGICDKARFLLYMADRAQHVEKLIKPALAEKKIVLCDRYSDSTYAYQPQEFPIWDLDRFTTCGLMPTITFLLDVSPETACERIYQRDENPPSEREREFLRRVRQNYLDRSETYPYQYKVLDAEQDADAVFEAAIKEIKGAHRGL